MVCVAVASMILDLQFCSVNRSDTDRRTGQILFCFFVSDRYTPHFIKALLWSVSNWERSIENCSMISENYFLILEYFSMPKLVTRNKCIFWESRLWCSCACCDNFLWWSGGWI